MKSKIIEIVEFGQPKSLIQRENEPITELIDTNLLIEELNQALHLFAVRQSLLSDVYTEFDIDKAYKCGERQSTFYKNNGTVILPRNYEGVDG